MMSNIGSLTILSIAVFFISCNTADDLGEFYEGTFNDSVLIISKADTVNIVLEQGKTQFHKDIIPYSIETVSINTDTILLNLFVSYGSYNKNPNPLKEINEDSDTVYVWYSLRGKMTNAFYKNNAVTKANTSPQISYVSIDSIAVEISKNKIIQLITRLVE